MSPDKTRLRHLTPRILTDRYGGRERWFQRMLPKMRADGAVSKVGRLYWGSFEAVEKWLQTAGSKDSAA